MAAEFIDPFDQPSVGSGRSDQGQQPPQLGPRAAPRVQINVQPQAIPQATPQASPQATPPFADPFDQPPAAPQPDPLRFGSAMPNLQVPTSQPGVPRNPAWPPGSPRGDGTEVRQQPPGTVSFNPSDPGADNFGGDAGFLTTLKASLVPETSPENMRKQFRIYSRDMGIPENRFFIDNEGNPAWIDMKGNKHLVVPTVGGGDWKQPADMARRVGAAVGDNVGASVGPVVGGVAAMAGGPLAGAAVAGAADLGRQAAGNYFAGEDKPFANLDYGNAAWQAAGVGAAEVAGQVGTALITRMLSPGNPFNLREGEIKQLQQALPMARQRADAAEKLGIHATPYDLTDLPFLQRLETTVAKQPGYAGDIMKRYYDERADFNFPNAVGNLFAKISKEGSPDVGLDKLRRGADETLAHIRNQQVNQGVRGGWGDAISSGARPDVREAVAEIQARLPHTSGPVKAELQRILGELKDGQSLVTDFERLHNARLDLQGTLDGYRRTLPPSERGRMTEVLDPIFAKFNQALETAHPRYAAGTQAYQEAGNAAADLRDGVLTLLSKDPEINSKLGSTLFNADAETVKKARQLFISAGQGDAWDAGTRAFLEGNLRSSRGPRVSSNFAGKTAPYDSHRLALDEALPEETRELTRHVLDIGQAQGRVPRVPNRAEVENVRLEDRTMGRAPVGETVRAALSPFRYLKELGDDVVARAYNGNAVDMADRLTGGLASGAGRGTPTVMADLNESGRPFFGGWQRQLLERALATGGGIGAAAAGRYNGLLGQPDPTEPTAEDLIRGGLLQFR